MEPEKFTESVDKMLRATKGGYSIKRWLIVLFTATILILVAVHTNKDNLIAVLTILISVLWVLLGYNNAEKKIDAKHEIDKLTIEGGQKGEPV